MKTSVVIPSYNPALKLPETLEKLIPQASFIDELIIIIDNNNYNEFAKSLLEKYSSTLKIRIFPQPNSGRGKSRNRGAELAGGDIIIFLDDDMLAEKNLIERHMEYHHKNPGIIVSGNGYRNPESANYDFGKFLINMENGWKNKVKGIGEITFENFNFTACNMSLPKSLFQQLGGFDARFSDGEDFDFAIRALNKNIKIVYDNTLIAWHNDWPTLRNFISRQKEYTQAKNEIFKIYPEYLERFSNRLPATPPFYKKIAGKLLKVPITWFSSTHNSIFAVLPRKARFLFYQLTIAVNSND